MKVGTLLNLFNDWNKYIIINDNSLNRLYNARTKIFEFMDEKEKHNLWTKKKSIKIYSAKKSYRLDFTTMISA